MSMKKEDQDAPSSSNLESTNQAGEDQPASAGISLDDEWAAALAEQEQGDPTPAAPDPQTTTTTETPAPEPSLDDEWAAALAEQEQGDPTPAASDSQATATPETPAPEPSLDDEWAAALAEQEQGDPTPAASDPQATTTPETPAPEPSLDDEWAAALAEQEQGDPTPAASDSQATTTKETAAPEPSLEDEWAAALAEQGQPDSLPAQEEPTKAENSPQIQDEVSASPLGDPADSSSTEDEDLENDWAEVLEEQTQKSQEKETPPPAQDAVAEDSDQVVMNWPGSGSAQPSPQPASSEWKPKTLSAKPESATATELPSPEEMLAAVEASSKTPEPSTPQKEEQLVATEPPSELSLAAAAAQTSIDAAILGADEITAILQTNPTKELADQAGSETPTVANAPNAKEVDPAPPNPTPPPPDLEPQSTGEAPDRFRRPFFTGNGSTLFGMFTINTLLTLLTFGVYSFWGRTKIRRYLHSQTKFAGARLAFHGTGEELFRGWMKAVLVFGIPYAALNVVSTLQTEATFQWGVNIIAGLLIFCFIPIAIVGSHRYRMTRTSWRGIYFSFRHSAKDFFRLYLKGTFLSVFTLGIYYPVFENAKRTFLVSGTQFGSRTFDFDGNAKTLGSIYFKAFRILVLTLVTAEVVLLATSFLTGRTHPDQMIDIVFWATVGMVSMVVPFIIGLWFWFQATKQRYMWSHTTFGGARFRATMKGKDVFELKVTNLLLLLFSLGLAWPWVQTRNLQFLYYHVGLQGPLNLQNIVQEAGTASPMGEELAGFFDTGFDLG
ncbi:DUF898 family protein [Candidatus Nitronereus thalassa]|uniref:DUF898 family protein n=1 Tax=Candidatus Nitronereus thalassa TaxID=3020898 RepID=A0ABU3K702_9BACT|nr:DUF898 family protein [Candidatus Nitronereus thalassa]MDT7042133.1 DUF898 family protein [Candidatus Nitronereus thalassa]